MPLISDQAIVLRRTEYSESSQVVTLFSRTNGKVRVIAKGARRSTAKRFNAGMELLEVGQLVFFVRQVGQEALATLTEWKQTRVFLGLTETLPRFHASQYVADVVSALTEDWDAHPTLFDQTVAFLSQLSQGKNVIPGLVTFQRQLLDEVGLLPQTDRCVGCGGGLEQSRDIYFSSHEGGLLCRNCEGARVEKRRVAVRRAVLEGTSPTTDADQGGWFDLFDYHLSHIMERQPSSCALLRRYALALQTQPPN